MIRCVIIKNNSVPYIASGRPDNVICKRSYCSKIIVLMFKPVDIVFFTSGQAVCQPIFIRTKGLWVPFHD
jgi:hypothetical protein